MVLRRNDWGHEIALPALSVGGLDRSEDLRVPARIAAAWPHAKVMRVDASGRFLVRHAPHGAQLDFQDAAALGSSPPADAVLLGNVDGTDYWALVVTQLVSDPRHAGPHHDHHQVASVRTAGPLLTDVHAAMATTAAALAHWHTRYRFCAQCSAPTVAVDAGHSRICPADHREFPRTDPAVIVLVHDGDGNAVLARQPTWEPHRFSVLAGFAEAGESLESTVVREVHEEIGVPVGQVRYLGSQPWPVPRSLMIAFSALAPPGAPLTPRLGEIEQARWFSRDELARIFQQEEQARTRTRSGHTSPRIPGRSSAPTDENAQITLPGPVSIARRMLESFVHNG